MILLARLLLVDVKAPLISDAICAELLITAPSASPSSAVILLARLELTAVNEPLIPADVNDETNPLKLMSHLCFHALHLIQLSHLKLLRQ